MTTATSSSTLRRQLDALNRHDVETFASCYADDAEVFDPAYPELLRGRDAVAKDMSDFLAAFPDLEASVSRVIDNGDSLAYEITMRGTHRGSLIAPTGHIPATNRKVEIGGGILVRLGADGRIVEERRYYDLTGLLYQLGQLQ
jgi:steroid delta-isomerase-like uncharacterized protein